MRIIAVSPDRTAALVLQRGMEGWTPELSERLRRMQAQETSVRDAGMWLSNVLNEAALNLRLKRAFEEREHMYSKLGRVKRLRYRLADLVRGN